MGSLAELLSTEDVEDCPLPDKPGCVPGSLSPPALPHVPLLLPTPCLQGDPQATRGRRGPGAAQRGGVRLSQGRDLPKPRECLRELLHVSRWKGVGGQLP